MKKTLLVCVIILSLVIPWLDLPAQVNAQSADDPLPLAQPVKLIFIHHSTGGNWLAAPDGNELGGGLGRALMENNYFVSATNYSWGPDGIGDRTDIINWPEWFTGPNHDALLAALYTENGQNFGGFGEWPRLAQDPGGENQIVLLKSCFPNSNMGGSPDDLPAETINEDLTVANAKAIYNDLLTYFITRPDKLFVVITAPPLADFDTDAASADNARAFNDWLVREWLSEYPYPNVAVFDFYNVLTSGPGADRNDVSQSTGNHHRWWDGAVQHIQTADNNFLVYPSGDSHPSRAGNEKATAEFVPLLNVYYNRWRAATPAEPPAETAQAQPAPETPPTEAPAAAASQPAAGIDDFEALPAGTDGWQFFWDETTATKIACAPDSSAFHSGSQSLQIEFNVAANSWATCALSFDQPRDWSDWQGISFYLHASQAALVFNVDLYRNTSQGTETYQTAIEAPPDSVEDWVVYTITWEQFVRVAWEAEAGTPLGDLAHVEGMAFGFDTYPDTPNTGVIWIDALQLLGPGEENPPVSPVEPVEPTQEPSGLEEIAPEETTPEGAILTESSPSGAELPEPTQASPTTPPESEAKPRGRLCASAIVTPLAAAFAAWTWKRKESK